MHFPISIYKKKKPGSKYFLQCVVLRVLVPVEHCGLDASLATRPDGFLIRLGAGSARVPRSTVDGLESSARKLRRAGLTQRSGGFRSHRGGIRSHRRSGGDGERDGCCGERGVCCALGV